MIEILQHVLGALTDNTIAFYKKILTALVLLFLAFAINDLFSLSFNHRIDKRIEQIQALKKVGSAADALLMQRDAAAVAAQIRAHKPVLMKAERLLVNLASNRMSRDQQTFMWKFLSAASLFIVTLLITPIVEKETNERALMVAGLLVMAVPTVSLLMLIPTFAYPWINYALNILIPSAVFTILYFADEEEATE